MSTLRLPSIRRQVYWSVIIPLPILLILCGIVGVLKMESLAWALMAGTACWFFPTLYMAYRLFHRIKTQPQQFVVLFFRTEVEKLILVAILFIAVIKLSSIPFIGILAGYLSAQFSSWIVSAICLR